MTALEALIPEFISILKKDTETIEILQGSLKFYEQRCELLQQVQKYMRDSVRTIVCDIIANNPLLLDPEGTRYGQDLRTLIKK